MQIESPAPDVGINILPGLVKEHVCPFILGVSQCGVGGAQGGKHVMRVMCAYDPAIELQGAMRPGIETGQNGGRTRNRECAGRRMVMIDDRMVRKRIHMRHGLAWITVYGQMMRRPGVEYKDEDVVPVWRG